MSSSVVSHSRIFRNRIPEYRKKAGLSQLELAVRVGVSRNAISSIERGAIPTCVTAMRIASALDCPFEDIFYFDER